MNANSKIGRILLISFSNRTAWLINLNSEHKIINRRMYTSLKHTKQFSLNQAHMQGYKPTLKQFKELKFK